MHKSASQEIHNCFNTVMEKKICAHTHTHTHTRKHRRSQAKKRCVLSHLCIFQTHQRKYLHPLLQRKKSQRDFWWEKCAFLRWWSDRGGVQPNVKDDKWKGAETRSHTQTRHRQAGHREILSSSLIKAHMQIHTHTSELKLSHSCLKNLLELTSSFQLICNKDNTT